MFKLFNPTTPSFTLIRSLRSVRSVRYSSSKSDRVEIPPVKNEGMMASPRKRLRTIPRVPATSNIGRKELYLDMLFNGYRPLLQPISENHTSYEDLGHPPSAFSPFSTTRRMRTSRRDEIAAVRKPNSGILEDLAKYKSIKKAHKLKNYNPYFSNTQKFTPIYTVFTNTALNTEQHNLELFNLPLRIVENLRPFQATNQPGHERFRDDIIYTRRLEVEERRLKGKEKRKARYVKDMKLAKKGLKRLVVEDPAEFFGFK